MIVGRGYSITKNNRGIKGLNIVIKAKIWYSITKNNNGGNKLCFLSQQWEKKGNVQELWDM